MEEEGVCDQLIQRWVNPHSLEQIETQYCVHVSITGYFNVSVYLFKNVLPAKKVMFIPSWGSIVQVCGVITSIFM